jgi:hypothetical protein
MALEATHSDRVVRDDVRQEPSPMDRVGGHEINDVDLSQLLNFGQIVIQWRVRKPKERRLKRTDGHLHMSTRRGREWGSVAGLPVTYCHCNAAGSAGAEARRHAFRSAMSSSSSFRRKAGPSLSRVLRKSRRPARADEWPIQQRTAIGFAQFTRSYSLTTALAPFTPRVWLTISLCAALPM